ncbi:CMP-N,N'-diacetyllegionaminic acid synthase [Alteromonadaceae bacterium Bs31]|nr:CMP-N,N'-diacetyllegionaminic acid synthase [Alteromonadaceae bacterium Bs31]
MIPKGKVLAIVPARGGSKGLPGKNIKELGGEPLIYWTVSAALSSEKVDSVVVSTDCSQIAEAARQAGARVPYMRPANISTDSATSAEVVLHALEEVGAEYDVVVLLQPTSPFRTTEDIDKAISLLDFDDENASVVSVCKSDKSPYWMFWKGKNGTLEPVMKDEHTYFRRQDLKDAYLLNGAIYVFLKNSFLKHKKFVFKSTVMYEMSKLTSVDIDDELDFKFARSNWER